MRAPFLRCQDSFHCRSVPSSFFLCFTTTGQPLFCRFSYKLMDHKMWKGISFCFGLGGKTIYTYLCALAAGQSFSKRFSIFWHQGWCFVQQLSDAGFNKCNSIFFSSRELARDKCTEMTFGLFTRKSHIKYQFSFGVSQRHGNALKKKDTVFKNHTKSLILHCELRLHFEWTKVHKNCQKQSIMRVFEKMRHFELLQTLCLSGKFKMYLG